MNKLHKYACKLLVSVWDKKNAYISSSVRELPWSTARNYLLVNLEKTKKYKNLVSLLATIFSLLAKFSTGPGFGQGRRIIYWLWICYWCSVFSCAWPLWNTLFRVRLHTCPVYVPPWKNGLVRMGCETPRDKCITLNAQKQRHVNVHSNYSWPLTSNTWVLSQRSTSAVESAQLVSVGPHLSL